MYKYIKLPDPWTWKTCLILRLNVSHSESILILEIVQHDLDMA